MINFIRARSHVDPVDLSPITSSDSHYRAASYSLDGPLRLPRQHLSCIAPSHHPRIFPAHPPASQVGNNKYCQHENDTVSRQITHQEEKKMDLTQEPVKEFCATEHSLLLDIAELSSLKSEASTLRESKKCGQRALDTPHISHSHEEKEGRIG